MSVEMSQDLRNDGVVCDESEDLHLSAALGTCQRVDFKDTENELCPTSVESAPRRRRLGLVLSGLMSLVTEDGQPKLLDFGLAKVATPATLVDRSRSPTIMNDTAHGVVLGTVPYMSPEQADAQPVDERTDIWALGCVMYEVLTGRPAFKEETLSETVARIRDGEPDWSLLSAEVPNELRHLVRECLAKIGVRAEVQRRGRGRHAHTVECRRTGSHSPPRLGRDTTRYCRCRRRVVEPSARIGFRNPSHQSEADHTRSRRRGPTQRGRRTGAGLPTSPSRAGTGIYGLPSSVPIDIGIARKTAQEAESIAGLVAGWSIVFARNVETPMLFAAAPEG